MENQTENTIYGQVSPPEFTPQESSENKEEDLTLKELMNLKTSGKLDEEVLRKLSVAFENDFTTEQACRYAGITDRTFRNWQKRSSEFSEKMQSSKDFVAIAAKRNVAQAIIGKPLKDAEGKIIPGEYEVEPSVEDSWRWLERREKKLYSPRTELTGEEGQNIHVTVDGIEV